MWPPGPRHPKENTKQVNKQNTRIQGGKGSVYHDSIPNCKLNIISTRKIEKLINQSEKILEEKMQNI